MEERVLATIRRHRMFEQGDRVLAAVSGGPDSIALVSVLHALAGRLQVEGAICHIHHGLRGDEADGDAAFVESFAGALGLPFHLVKRPPCAWETAGRSRQHAARAMRYRVLEALAETGGYSKIATGHTLSDQAETVLLRAASGTGLDGLSGIAPVRGGRIVRPLIDVTRNEVLAYLKGEGLLHREDASNASRKYDRNRVRLDVMPMIKQALNPKAERALARLADNAREDAAFLDRIAADFVEANVTSADQEARVAVKSLQPQPRGLRRRVMRRLFAERSGSTWGLSHEHVSRADAVTVSDAEPAACSLPFGLEWRRDGAFLGLRSTGDPVPYDLPLPLGAAVDVPGTGATVATCRVDAVPDKPWPADECYLDLASRGLLRVRSWREGDRMRPEGMAGAVKLQDLFTDRKIGRLARRRWPVVVCGDEIVWVAGVRRAGGGVAAPGEPGISLVFERGEETPR